MYRGAATGDGSHFSHFTLICVRFVWFALAKAGGMELSLCLAAFLLIVQWTWLPNAQSASDSIVQPLVNSEDVSLSGTIVNEPSLSVQTSANSDAGTLVVQQEGSSSNALDIASSVITESSPTLVIPSASSATPLPSAPPSSSNPAITAVTSSSSGISQTVLFPPSPSASAVPPASSLIGSITSNNLTEEFIGMCYAYALVSAVHVCTYM